MNMEDSIDIRPKGLLRRHPKLSNKSKNTSLGLKLMEICIVNFDQFFGNMHEVKIDQNDFFF